jgi:hypothetical protein
MIKKSISQSDIKILWGKSGNKCAKCRTDLIQEEKEDNKYHIGEMAHIKGENPTSARYDPSMTDDERNGYNNLILLCRNCHLRIDKNCEEFTVEKLVQIKKDHEKWVAESLKKHMPNVTFAELEVIIKHLIATSPLENENYLTIVPLKEKMRKNKLSQEVENDITIGMLKVKQVKDYLNRNPDIQFAERLRAGFINKYRELKYKGVEGDALFYALRDFASNSSPDFKYITAGLSVLTYFFELCEVFEG